MVFRIYRDDLACGKVLDEQGANLNLAMCPRCGVVPLVSEGFFCCIHPPHSCNLKVVQNLLQKYEKESSEK